MMGLTLESIIWLHDFQKIYIFLDTIFFLNDIIVNTLKIIDSKACLVRDSKQQFLVFKY